MTLALVAGPGGVPPHLVKTLLARGEVPLVCELVQSPSEIQGDLPRVSFRFETFGTLLQDLVARGIARLCIAGVLRIGAVDPSRIDAATIAHLPRLQGALRRGEDATLREIIAIVEEAGIGVLGAAEIAPDLLPNAGLTHGAVPEGIAADLAAAQAAHAEMARTGPGQAVVVRGGRVVAKADGRGTDAMLRDLATPEDPGGDWSFDPFDLADQVIGGAADWLSGQEAEEATTGGVLYIAPRPGQDPRVDLPLLAPYSARCAVDARLSGIVIEADGVMLLAPETVRQTLAAAGLFLLVRPAGPA
jgi:DUF1009 family protein